MARGTLLGGTLGRRSSSWRAIISFARAAPSPLSLDAAACSPRRARTRATEGREPQSAQRDAGARAALQRLPSALGARPGRAAGDCGRRGRVRLGANRRLHRRCRTPVSARRRSAVECRGTQVATVSAVRAARRNRRRRDVLGSTISKVTHYSKRMTKLKRDCDLCNVERPPLPTRRAEQPLRTASLRFR